MGKMSLTSCRALSTPEKFSNVDRYVLHDGRFSYSAVNSAWSALSSYFPEVEGKRLGSHPHVICIMKSICNTNPPPAPRYERFWDVNDVFRLLCTWHPAECLSLKKLSFKTLVLFLLTTAERSQTALLLKADRIVITDRLVISLDEPSTPLAAPSAVPASPIRSTAAARGIISRFVAAALIRICSPFFKIGGV